MGPLQKKAKASQIRLQAAARDFAVARQRTLRRQRMNGTVYGGDGCDICDT